MKKIVTLFTIVTLIVALASCNGGTKSTEINEDTMVVSEDPTLVVDSISVDSEMTSEDIK
jgi:hypothetical protein